MRRNRDPMEPGRGRPERLLLYGGPHDGEERALIGVGELPELIVDDVQGQYRLERGRDAGAGRGRARYRWVPPRPPSGRRAQKEAREP